MLPRSLGVRGDVERRRHRRVELVEQVDVEVPQVRQVLVRDEAHHLGCQARPGPVDGGLVERHSEEDRLRTFGPDRPRSGTGPTALSGTSRDRCGASRLDPSPRGTLGEHVGMRRHRRPPFPWLRAPGRPGQPVDRNRSPGCSPTSPPRSNRQMLDPSRVRAEDRLSFLEREPREVHDQLDGAFEVVPGKSVPSITRSGPTSRIVRPTRRDREHPERPPTRRSRRGRSSPAGTCRRDARLPPRPAAQVREDQGEVGERLEHRAKAAARRRVGRPGRPRVGAPPEAEIDAGPGRSAGSEDRRAGRPGQRDGPCPRPANLHHLTEMRPRRLRGRRDAPRRTPSARDARRRPRARPPVGRDEPITACSAGPAVRSTSSRRATAKRLAMTAWAKPSRIAVSASSRSPSKREKTTSCPGLTPRSRTRPSRARPPPSTGRGADACRSGPDRPTCASLRRSAAGLRAALGAFVATSGPSRLMRMTEELDAEVRGQVGGDAGPNVELQVHSTRSNPTTSARSATVASVSRRSG